MQYKIGQIVEIRHSKKKKDVSTCEILSFRGEDFFLTHGSDPVNYPDILSLIMIQEIIRVVSDPLDFGDREVVSDPLDFGDRQIAESDKKLPELRIDDRVSLPCGSIVSIFALGNKYFKYLDSQGFEKSALISDIATVVSRRGGKRLGAGRKPSGKESKKRKAIQLDQDLAAKLPNLKMLADLLDEFRPSGESVPLRSTKLAEFYKKLDALPYIC